MKEVLLNNSLNLIIKNNPKYSDEDIEKLKYGLEGIYLTITKTIIILIASMILGITKNVIAILILFNIIRYFAFGFHAEKSSHCLIFSSVLFIGLPLLIFHLKPNNTITLIIAIVCTIIITIFAPADTQKRPLPNKKKRKIRKIVSSMISIIYLSTIVLTNYHISYLFLCTLIIQTMNINPITYMIFKQPFNNYKTYIQD